jgi:hypothetical protein
VEGSAGGGRGVVAASAGVAVALEHVPRLVADDHQLVLGAGVLLVLVGEERP